MIFYFRKRSDNADKQDAAAALLDLSATLSDPGQISLDEAPQPFKKSRGTQSDMTAKDISKLEKELEQHKAWIKKMTLDEDSFRDNDNKVKCFTGLPSFAVLMVLFQAVKPFLKQHSTLSPFHQFMVTLMRMHMNMGVEHLGFTFGVCKSTISTIFDHTLDVMFHKLVPSLLFWPGRDELRKTLPTSFRSRFSKCACIIDCFEIFIERSSNLLARAQTWSSYKHHNTVKYLIGIAPQGVTIFLSKGFGGRCSDVWVTEHCGFLQKLLPGDLILADRGFDISEMLQKVMAILGIPAFTKGKKQLDPLDLENTRKLANCRIHVERVIGVVRQKYQMLESTIPLTMLEADNDGYTQLDKIVAVCCALTNCCPSVVAFD